jgi:hypothetical protein
LIEGATWSMQNPGEAAPRERFWLFENRIAARLLRRHSHSSLPGSTGRPSISETPVTESIGRGVLDRPIKSGDDDRAHAFDRIPAGLMKLTPRRHKNAPAKRISEGIEPA